ncbi:outer membrane beta-barrel protein [uncultured Abyssibacter sp.]|uniref:outer membrane beta-barrel protein n=1 Tax=uncultured Abyssibacter sp. TaxID=2320202 RepID=UPI0032B1F30F
MNMMFKTACATGLAATLCAPAALAQTDFDPYGYVGADIGYFRVESEDFPEDDDNVEDSRTSYRLRVGGRFAPVIGIEGGYVDFGDYEDGAVDYTADGLTLAGVLYIPLGERASLYGKLGELFWDAEATAEGAVGSVSRETDGEDVFYGVGANLPLGEVVALNIGYERYALDDVDVDLAAIGLDLQFGGSGY